LGPKDGKIWGLVQKSLCVIMAARQLAGRRPLYFIEVCFYPLTFVFIFRRLILEVSGPIVTNNATCSVVTVTYKFESEIWEVPPPKKKLRPKITDLTVLITAVNMSKDTQYKLTGTFA